MITIIPKVESVLELKSVQHGRCYKISGCKKTWLYHEDGDLVLCTGREKLVNLKNGFGIDTSIVGVNDPLRFKEVNITIKEE